MEKFYEIGKVGIFSSCLLLYVLSTSHVHALSCFLASHDGILTTRLQGRYYYSLFLIDEETDSE